jgi:hypothetical protein
MVQVREGARDADGMDIALSMARELYMAVDIAVRQGYSSPEERREVEALADIRCGWVINMPAWPAASMPRNPLTGLTSTGTTSKTWR